MGLTACGSSSDGGGSGADDAGSGDSTSSLAWVTPAGDIAGVEQRTIGEGAEGAVVLTANGEPPAEPIAVYLHSWSPLPPSTQSDPVRGLVKAGFTVIYPVYQDFKTEEAELLPAAAAGVRATLDELELSPESLVALGPNVGGALAFDLAAVAAANGLPPIAAAAAVSPGREPSGKLPRPDYGRIPSSARLLTADLPGSKIPGTGAEARRMLRLATAVPAARKQHVRLAAPRREGIREVMDWTPILDFIEYPN